MKTPVNITLTLLYNLNNTSIFFQWKGNFAGVWNSFHSCGVHVFLTAVFQRFVKSWRKRKSMNFFSHHISDSPFVWMYIWIIKIKITLTRFYSRYTTRTIKKNFELLVLISKKEINKWRWFSKSISLSPSSLKFQN